MNALHQNDPRASTQRQDGPTWAGYVPLQPAQGFSEDARRSYLQTIENTNGLLQMKGLTLDNLKETL